MLAVEACMRAYARVRRGRKQMGITGLLTCLIMKISHPPSPPFIGSKILEERGYPEHLLRASSPSDDNGVKREAKWKRRLSCASFPVLLRFGAGPAEQSLAEVSAKSVRKKMKDKPSLPTCKRDDIINGAATWARSGRTHCVFALKR